MDDLISRQAAIDALKRAEALTRAFGYHNVIDTIRELPTAEKTGKWESVTFKTVPHDRISKAKKCSVCGKRKDKYVTWNYCPNCGARMEE